MLEIFREPRRFVAMKAPTHLFLDTEWADETGRQLVSLALVSEDDRHCFYSEVDPLPNHPTDWAKAVVYPLLQHGYAARQKVDFTRDLRAFLARFDAPVVLFDHVADGVLFDHALAGFDLPANLAKKLGTMPFMTKTLVQHEEVRLGIERYFREHSEHADRRHHAGVDAEALRWAFVTTLEMTS